MSSAASALDQDLLALLARSSLTDKQPEPNSSASQLSASLFPISTYTPTEQSSIDSWTAKAATIGTSAAELDALNTHLASRTTVLGSKPSVADIALYKALAPVVGGWSAEERTGEKGRHHIVRFVDYVQNGEDFGLQLPDGTSEKVKINVDEVLVPIKPVDAKAEKERKKKEKEAAAAAAAAAAPAGTGSGDANKTAEASSKAPTTPSKIERAKGKVAAAISAFEEKAEHAAAEASAATPPKASGSKKEGKKEKKEKGPRPQKAAAVEKPLSPALIDLRVGHILKAETHPNADSLYVSTIAMGDKPGTDNTSEFEGQVVRTVCSGLNGLVPLDEMQGRKIVAVANLKPVTMRGIKSCAMVLAASPRNAECHGGPVELVDPPEGAEAGEKVWFEGWEGEPEPVLNPKKKVWESCQPGFTTTEGRQVVFDVGACEAFKGKIDEGREGSKGVLKTAKGVCMVKTLTGATVR